MSTNL